VNDHLKSRAWRFSEKDKGSRNTGPRMNEYRGPSEEKKKLPQVIGFLDAGQVTNIGATHSKVGSVYPSKDRVTVKTAQKTAAFGKRRQKKKNLAGFWGAAGNRKDSTKSRREGRESGKGTVRGGRSARSATPLK